MDVDLWVRIGGCVSMLLMFCFLIYQQEAVSHLGFIIPLMAFLSGYILHQSFEEIAIRGKSK